MPPALAKLTRPELLWGRKLENRRLLELLSRLQNRAWELRTVRRIREMLRFKAKSVPALVDVPFFSSHAAIEEIPGIELDSRLCRPDFQTASAGGFMNARRQLHAILAGAVIEHEVVIVSVA